MLWDPDLWNQLHRSAITPSVQGRPEAVVAVQQHLWENRFSRVLRRAPFDSRRQELKKTTGRMGVCRWCGVGIVNGRTSWCSDACEQAFYIRFSPAYARARIERRDRGVCAVCGVDVLENLRRWRAELSELQRDYHDFLIVAGVCRALQPDWRYFSDRTGWVFSRRYRFRPTKAGQLRRDVIRCSCGGCVPSFVTTWEADHVVPVVEGGGCCGLEGYRTLCPQCHKTVTKDLRGRLRAQRKRCGRGEESKEREPGG